MKLTTQFNLRMSPEEFKTIQSMAAKTGQSMNAYIISKCLETPIKQAKPPVSKPQTEAKEIEPQDAIQGAEKVKPWSGGYGKAISSK